MFSSHTILIRSLPFKFKSLAFRWIMDAFLHEPTELKSTTQIEPIETQSVKRAHSKRRSAMKRALRVRLVAPPCTEAASSVGASTAGTGRTKVSVNFARCESYGGITRWITMWSSRSCSILPFEWLFWNLFTYLFGTPTFFDSLRIYRFQIGSVHPASKRTAASNRRLCGPERSHAHLAAATLSGRKNRSGLSSSVRSVCGRHLLASEILAQPNESHHLQPQPIDHLQHSGVRWERRLRSRAQSVRRD